MLTFLPAIIFLIALAHGETSLMLPAGLLSAVGAAVTVYCTGMIYASLKPVRDLLRSRVQTGDGNEDSDKVWREQLTDAVHDAELEIQILLGKLSMSLQDLQNMQPGDVLPFKKPESARAMIEDMPVFEVEVGALGSQVAVKITDAISPNLTA